MKISIITATFNSAATVRDTIESVLGQTHQDWEIVIKDGGSKDNTLAICSEYTDERIRIVAAPDKGIYDAMNQGVEAATGDVIGILNSDDFYYDNAVLADIAKAMEEGADATCGDLYFVDAQDTSKVVRTWKGSPYKSFRDGWHPAHPTFYVKREFFEKYGAFDISYDVSADFELMLRFIEKHGAKVQYLNRVMVKMRQGGESTGSIKNIVKGNKNIRRAFKKNGLPVPMFYTLRRLLPKAVNVVRTKISKNKK